MRNLCLQIDPASEEIDEMTSLFNATMPQGGGFRGTLTSLDSDIASLLDANECSKAFRALSLPMHDSILGAIMYKPPWEPDFFYYSADEISWKQLYDWIYSVQFTGLEEVQILSLLRQYNAQHVNVN